MSFELQHLRQVIALAEHGSFVRAAATLHISQPALSRSIQQLEQRFGSQLFLRTTAGVVPTDLGRVYIERARDVLRLADDLDREAVSQGHLRSGRVAVGGGPYPSDAVLGRAAAKFVEQHPGIGISVNVRNWDDLARQLRSRELDFFIAETSTLHRESDLDIEPMPSAHSVHFYARAGHPLAMRSSFTFADVFEWPIVVPARVPPRILDPMLAAQRVALRRVAVRRPFPSIECNALAPAKRIVATSDAIGASILSCIAGELEGGQVVLLGHEPWMHLQYGIVRLRGHPLTQVAELFREFVLDAEAATVREEERLHRKFGRARGARPKKRGQVRPPRNGV